MIKKGFTIAEVLITITIIGVVAALGLPALNSNIQRNSWTTGLSAANNILTNGFSQMLAIENTNHIDSTQLWSEYVSSDVSTLNNNIKNIFAKYFNLTNGNNEEYIVSNVDGGNAEISGFRLDLSNKTSLFLTLHPYATNESCSAIKENGGNLCEDMADIFVDINGNKGPNKIGYDIHAFILGNDGRIFPYGSIDTKLFLQSQQSDPEDETTPAPKVWNEEGGCQGNDPSQIPNSINCTARVIAEGYKIQY